MSRGPDEIYVAAFVARCDAFSPGRTGVQAPGLHGLPPSAGEPHTRLLITDDRAYDLVAALLPDARTGMINVFAAAERCLELIDHHLAWRSDAVTAMICRDLRAVQSLSLPDGLTFRPVHRLPTDPHDGVPLQDAVVAASAAAPAIDEPRAFTEYLRSLPSEFRLFAAVDADGVIRATSGAGAFGDEATVIFVNTDPGWRRQGIGLAMTAAALRSAYARGARHACLDASEAGASIYRRLGFESVTETTRFFSRG